MNPSKNLSFNTSNPLNMAVVEEKTGKLLNGLIATLSTKDIKAKKVFSEFVDVTETINKIAKAEDMSKLMHSFFSKFPYKNLIEINSVFDSQKQYFTEQLENAKHSKKSFLGFGGFASPRKTTFSNIDTTKYDTETFHYALEDTIHRVIKEKKMLMTDALDSIKEEPKLVFSVYTLPSKGTDSPIDLDQKEWQKSPEVKGLIAEAFRKFAIKTFCYDSVSFLEKVSEFYQVYQNTISVEKELKNIQDVLFPTLSMLSEEMGNQSSGSNAKVLEEEIKVLQLKENKELEKCKIIDGNLRDIWNTLYIDYFQKAGKYQINDTESNEFIDEYKKNLNSRKTSSEPGDPKTLIQLTTATKCLVIEKCLTKSTQDYFPASSEFNNLKEIYLGNENKK